MKVILTVDGKVVTVDLTKDQPGDSVDALNTNPVAYEQACEFLAMEPLDEIDFSFLPETHKERIFNLHKKLTIGEAISIGWDPKPY